MYLYVSHVLSVSSVRNYIYTYTYVHTLNETCIPHLHSCSKILGYLFYFDRKLDKFRLQHVKLMLYTIKEITIPIYF